jgi:putative ABC transport system permease protein
MRMRRLQPGEGPFLLGVILATAALASVTLLEGQFRQTLLRRTETTFGGALRLERSAPFPAPFLKALRAPSLKEARLVRFPTVVVHGRTTHLVELNATGPDYPVMGTVALRRSRTGRAEHLRRGPGPGHVWVTSELLDALKARMGSKITIGYATFRITGLFDLAPAISSGLSLFAPPLLLNRGDLDRTRLVGTESRIEDFLLVAGRASLLTQLKRKVRAWRPALDVRIVTARETRSRTEGAIRRAERFLNLTITGTLLLSLLALWLSAWDQARLERPEIALLRAWGLRRRALLFLLARRRLLQVGVGLGLGAALGFGLYRAIASLTAVLDPTGGLAAHSPWPGLLRSVAMAALLVMAGLVPSWLWILETSPLENFRPGSSGTPASVRRRVLWGGLALLTSYGLWYLLGGGASLRYTASGLGVLVGTAGFALLLLAGLRHLASRGPVDLGWVLASLNRRSVLLSCTLGSLTLVVCLVTFLLGARTSLFAGYQEMFSTKTPNWFVIGIEPGEQRKLAALLAHHHLEPAPFAPLYIARWVALDGKTLDPARIANPRERFWALHDQSVSATPVLPAGDRIETGRFWRRGSLRREASLVRGFARASGIGLGARLTYRIAGREFTVRVTSLRHVRWDRMTPNFFVDVTPRAVRGLPHTEITSLRAPPSARGWLALLPRRFPGVSTVDLDQIIRELRRVLTRASEAVSVLLATTLLAALLLAYLVVAVTREERARELTLFRTLGVRRARVWVWLLLEFGLLGLFSGILGSTAAWALGAFEARSLLHLRFHPDWQILGLAPVLTTGLTLALGLLAMAPSLWRARSGYWRSLRAFQEL